MKKKTSLRPTEAELEILQVLWQYGPSTVRFVNEKLNARKNVGYTTTLKIMQIMLEKKIVKRDAGQRSHLYSPALPARETRQLLLDKLLDTAFGGSAMNLVMQALGHHEASLEEISQIRDILDKSVGRGK